MSEEKLLVRKAKQEQSNCCFNFNLFCAQILANVQNSKISSCLEKWPLKVWAHSFAVYAYSRRIYLLEFFIVFFFLLTNNEKFQRANTTAIRVWCKWMHPLSSVLEVYAIMSCMTDFKSKWKFEYNSRLLSSNVCHNKRLKQTWITAKITQKWGKIQLCFMNKSWPNQASCFVAECVRHL